MKKRLSNLVLSFSRTKLGARMFSYIAHLIDRIVFRLTNKRTTFSGWLIGFPIIMLHSVGRKSGKVYTIPLVGVPDPDKDGSFLLVGSNFGKDKFPGWYHNIKAADEVACTLDGNRQDYVVEEVDDDSYSRLWDHIVAFNPVYASYKKALNGKRKIPVFRITPEPAQ